jgi:Ribbon-helix-helix protein, copG family
LYHRAVERTQISLTAEQAARLRRIASERGTSMAALIRDAVDQVVRDDQKPSDSELWDRFLGAAGRFHDVATDVAENHDVYLDEIYAERPLRRGGAPP